MEVMLKIKFTTNCSCLLRNGKRFVNSDCSQHGASDITPRLIVVGRTPVRIEDRRKKKLLIIRNVRGKRDDFCNRCTFDERGCITHLDFNCTVHAPQTGRL